MKISQTLCVLASMITASVALTCWSDPIHASESSVPRGEKVIEKIIQNRVVLNPAIIQFTISTTVDETPDNHWTSFSNDVTFWIKGGNRRLDMHHHGVTDKGAESSSDEQVFFLENGEYMRKNARTDLDIMVDSLRHQDHLSAVEHLNWDPRVIGLSPYQPTALWHYGLEDVFRYLTDGQLTVQERTHMGFRAISISSQYEALDGKPVSAEMLVVPEMGYSVVRAEVSRPDFQYTMRAENRKWLPQIWFPEKTVTELVVKQKLVVQEVVTVVDVRQPRSIASQEFTLSAMKLPIGRRVLAHGKQKLWDGNKLIPDPAYLNRDSRQPPVHVEQDGRSSGVFITVIFIVNALVFAGLAVYLLWSRKSA